MQFKSLKEKCEYYRSLVDYKLLPNSYVIAMVDGHCFSKLIKNKFKKPFDIEFINAMNETAVYLCENIQGAKLAYTQSDEISVLITDFDTPMTDSFFGYRLCKMQSLIASMATAKFNQIMAENHPGLYEFDCKCWTVPNANDAYAWFLCRQTDCIKNSKQQAAQTYLPHKALLNHTSDEQIELLKSEKGIDWHEYSNGEKYGRFVYKIKGEFEKDLPSGEHIKFERNMWTAVQTNDIKEDNSIREMISNIGKKEEVIAQDNNAGSKAIIVANSDYLEHSYVDLGLPSGTKWATMNIGAEKETDYGLYFAWGETQGYTGITDEKQFSWDDYKYGTSSSNLTKYNSTDGLTTLEPSDDAATVNWGGKWKMPTVEQINELLNASNCICKWVKNYNGSKANGILFISVRNNKKLFVPASKKCTNESIFQIIGNNVTIWSSSLSSVFGNCGMTLDCDVDGGMDLQSIYRYLGLPIRPVFE